MKLESKCGGFVGCAIGGLGWYAYTLGSIPGWLSWCVMGIVIAAVFIAGFYFALIALEEARK